MLRVYTSGGNTVSCCLHLAALKAVGESVRSPLRYYTNNVTGGLVLLDCLEAVGVRRFVFSRQDILPTREQ